MLYYGYSYISEEVYELDSVSVYIQAMCIIIWFACNSRGNSLNFPHYMHAVAIIFIMCIFGSPCNSLNFPRYMHVYT